METVIECQICGDEMGITEDGISECATCAWFAATFRGEAVDIVAEQIRIDALDATWSRDAETFCEAR